MRKPVLPLMKNKGVIQPVHNIFVIVTSAPLLAVEVVYYNCIFTLYTLCG